jgi:UDP-N-acetylglucosamine 4,6-dehydratase
VNLDSASILLTGGTGSFSRRFVKRTLERWKPARLVVYSRDELKLQMRQEHPVDRFPNLRFFIGDIHDRDRLYRALDGVQVVVHAAALKQVPTAEYNPLEARYCTGRPVCRAAATDASLRRWLTCSTCAPKSFSST